MTYIKNPQDIYDESFRIIEREINREAYPKDILPIITRIIHACGMTEILPKIRYSDPIAQAIKEALKQEKPIIVDCEMMRAALIKKNLKNNDVICTLNHEKTQKIAQKKHITRSAAATELWNPYMHNAVIAIGNAPTALFALLEAIDRNAPKPAAIIAFPVGFVGAKEAKDALIKNNRNIPFITLKGRQGGSAMAAAALNAITQQ